MSCINSTIIYNTIKKLCLIANTKLPREEYFALKSLYENETNEKAKNVLAQILQNAKIAFEENRPLCQDTGFVTVFAEVGQEVKIQGENFEKVINNAVADAYKEYFLRKSLVQDPAYERINTKDNTPVLIHTRIVEGDKIDLTLSVKGGGCENISTFKMLTPTQGEIAITDFVIETIKNAGSKPCPPIRVGIGIGSNFEGAAFLSKKALLSSLENSQYPKLAIEIKNKINELEIGAMGLGGDSTCFGVNILHEPCHIASLPVAISISCHSSRHASASIEENEIIFKDEHYEFQEVEENIGKVHKIHTSEVEKIKKLKRTRMIELSGKIYVARDAVHQKFKELIQNDKELPIDLKNAIIFYAGPCPANENEIIGPIGPTTSARMDEITPYLYFCKGLLATIGKGYRSEDVYVAMKSVHARYFTITGGVASLLKKCVKSAKIIAYEELGAEALYELEVENLPVMVNF